MIRKVVWIAALPAGLFVPLAVVSMLFSTVGYHLFQPELYKQAIQKENIYSRLPELVADQLVYFFHQQPVVTKNISQRVLAPAPAGDVVELLPFLSRLTRSDWQSILDDVLPPAWVQAQTESVIDQISANISEGNPAPEVWISLAEVKDRLLSEHGKNAFLRLVNAQRPCRPEETDWYAAYEPIAFPLCKPLDGEALTWEPEFEWMMMSIVADIPDDVNIAQSLASILPQGPEPVRSSLAQGGASLGAVRWIRQGLMLAPTLPFGLLFLSTLLAVRSVGSLLRWWGIPFLASGLLGLALAAGVQPVVNGWVTWFVFRSSSSYLTVDLVRVLVNIAHSVVQPLGRWFGLEALILAGLGIGMLAASMLISDRKESSESEP